MTRSGGADPRRPVIDRLEIFQMGTAWRNLIVVRLTATDGAFGLGEATAQFGDEAVVAYLPVLFERYVRGQDPRHIEAIWQRILRSEYWRAGAVFSTAQGALDIACHDLLARSLGEPVHTLLGGAITESVPAYGNGWYQVERTPAAFAAAARAAVEKGFSRLKFDPFGHGELTLETRELDEAVSLVAAVREAIGPDRQLYIEGHGRFGVATAITVARALEPFRPGWLEEPVPPDNVDALREVTRSTTIPIAAGERWFSRHAFRRPLEIGAIRIAQPDIGHTGGLTEARKIAVMADTALVPVAFHNAASPLMTAVGVHLGSTLHNLMVLESFDEFMEPHVRAAFVDRPTLTDGAFRVPSGPGFGVEIDERIFAEHPPRSAVLDFWAPGWERRTSHYHEGDA